MFVSLDAVTEFVYSRKSNASLLKLVSVFSCALLCSGADRLVINVGISMDCIILRLENLCVSAQGGSLIILLMGFVKDLCDIWLRHKTCGIMFRTIHSIRSIGGFIGHGER